MRFGFVLLALWAFVAGLSPALAQEQSWIQIEAQPSLTEAQDRAKAYAALFPDVAGFKVNSGWYAIMLGPAPREAAAERLSNLRKEGMIPSDSFLTDGGDRGMQFWPTGQDAAAQTAAQPETVAASPAPIVEPDETLAEAKATEAALGDADRMALQEALSWYGLYDAAIDGHFGPGTRKSMQAWQEANGFAATGVMTSRQRGILLANFQADKAEFGFETIIEAESGIEITLPSSLVAFDHYEPPFVHFAEKNGSGLRIMLISEPGGTANLAGLYQMLQSLEVVPATGDRSLDEQSFTINARSEQVESLAYVEAGSGAVKGYLVVWKPDDAERMSRILPVLKASFRALGEKALDPGLVPLDAATKAGLLAGMQVKKPILSRSGFFVDATGTVVTTTEALADCGRISIDHDTDARILAQDAATGLAILAPLSPLAPRAFARFQTGPARPGSEITVAGYSYEDKLPAPVLTFGSLDEDKGLNGETGLLRLTAPVLPGDAGGPVLDASGAVLGMLLPAANGAKQLPAGVAFAANGATTSAALTAAGITPTEAGAGTAAISPDALNRAGLGMTVLVSCWQ